MEFWMWIIGISLAFGGFLWGMFLGKSGNTTTGSEESKARAKGLEVELGTVQNEFNKYRDEVTGHFRTTADLVHEMTNSYKSVYDHLATGSQQLCSGEVMLESDSSPRLETSQGGDSGNGSGEKKEKEETKVSAASPAGAAKAKAQEDAQTVH